MELSSSKVEKILVFWEMRFSIPKIKNVLILIFSQKKAFIILQEMEPFLKNSYISGGNIARSKTKRNQLRKNILYFRKWNFLAPSLRKLLIYQDENLKSQA